MVNKGVQNAVLGCNLKNDRMISLFVFKAFSIAVKFKAGVVVVINSQGN